MRRNRVHGIGYARWEAAMEGAIAAVSEMKKV